MEKIKKFKLSFTQVPNTVLNDKRLSLKAKGLYAYLFSKPDDWVFHIGIMEKELKESRGQIYSIIKELIQFGYIIRKQINENGKFGGIIYEFVENPHTEIPCTEKSAYGKTCTHNNIDNKEILINNNKYTYKFNEFWDKYPKQRAGSKQKALSAYMKAIKEKRTTEEDLLKAVALYAESDEVKRGFAKGCAAWLNDDRFLSEYKTTEKTEDFDDFLRKMKEEYDETV